MKQIKSVEQVISEMNATTNYEVLGIAPPNPQRVAELVHGVSKEIERIEASLPRPWNVMTIEEQNQWFAEMGIGELAASEMAEQFGGEGHATIVFFGLPHPDLHHGSIVAVQHPALVLLAKIVNGADTDNSLWHQPEAAGLNAIAEGIRNMGFKDDHEQNAAEWIVYDALYTYCKAMVGQGKANGAFVG